MVDADDELDPKYVSRMAGWLEEHREYDYAVCEHVFYTGRGADKVFSKMDPKEFHSDNASIIEEYLFHLIHPYAWIYMVRTGYLRKCRIIETYFTETKGSHEPGFVIPLLANKGKAKYFSSPLYHFNDNDEGHSRSKLFARMLEYDLEYKRLIDIATDSLPDSVLSSSRKAEVKELSLLGRYIRLYLKKNSLTDAERDIEMVFLKILEIYNSIRRNGPVVSREMTTGLERLFILAIKLKITGSTPTQSVRKETEVPTRRIIGYGAMGKSAKRMLPRLKGARWEPTELWDINGDGESIKKPDFDALTPDDLLVVFPIGKIEAELRKSFDSLPFRKMYYSDLRVWLVHSYCDLYNSQTGTTTY
jgi:hypothetical protein